MMREFFKGWRRKVGCVTLVMACVFAVGWVRSLTRRDTFDFGRVEIVSLESSLAVAIWPRSNLRLPQWFTEDSRSIDSVFGPHGCRSRGAGFWSSGIADLQSTLIVVAPYWSIVIPLTLLSAYLLLSKPRVAKTTSAQPDRSTAV